MSYQLLCLKLQQLCLLNYHPPRRLEPRENKIKYNKSFISEVKWKYEDVDVLCHDTW